MVAHGQNRAQSMTGLPPKSRLRAFYCTGIPMVTAVLPSSAKRALSAKAAAWPSILRRGERGITRPLSAAAGVRRQSPERSCRDPCRRRAGSVRPAPRRGRPPPGRGAAALSTGAATLRFARRREGISRCTAAGIPGQTRHAAAPVLESGERELDVLACPKIVGGEIRAGAVVLAKSPSTYRYIESVPAGSAVDRRSHSRDGGRSPLIQYSPAMPCLDRVEDKLRPILRADDSCHEGIIA